MVINRCKCSGVINTFNAKGFLKIVPKNAGVLGTYSGVFSGKAKI
jgi:hypothetical protein